MGLVEAVLGEGFHLAEKFLDLFLVVAALDAPLDEPFFLGGHLADFLFAHDLPEFVGFAHGKTGDAHRYLHDLFLEDDDAVGVFQDIFKVGKYVGHFFTAHFTVDVDVGHARLQRPGAVQGVEHDQVLDLGRLRLFQVIAHAGAFKLENAVGVAFLEHLERFAVKQVDVFQVDGHAQGFAHFADDVLDDGQGLQAEDVHFQQPDVFHFVLFEMGGDIVLGLVQRHVFGQFLRGDDHAGGMHGRVADVVFELEGVIDQLDRLRIVLDLALQFGVPFDDILQFHLGTFGDHLGQPVDLGQLDLHHAADVADGQLGLHAPEGDDLGHVVLAVLAADVGDDLVAAFAVEIDVDVRQADALGIEEAFEDQVVFQRVDVGDAHDERHQAADHRTAPRPDRDVGFLGEADDVPDDQEISREAHFPDLFYLVLQPLLVLLVAVLEMLGLGQVLVADALEAFQAYFFEIIVDGELARHLEAGQEILFQLEFEIAARGDLEGVVQAFRDGGKQLGHLLAGFEVQLLAFHLHRPFGIADHVVGLQTDQDLPGVGVLPGQVMDVVAGHQGNRKLAGQVGQLRQNLQLFLHAVVLDLQEKIVLECVLVPAGRGRRFLLVAAQQVVRHFALDAG